MLRFIASKTSPYFFRGATRATYDFAVSVTDIATLVSTGGTSTVTQSDAVLTANAGATVDHAPQVSVSVPLGVNYTITNLSPSIATLDPATMRMTRVADGAISLLVRSKSMSKIVCGSASRLLNTAVSTFSNFATGTLGAHLVNGITTLLAGKTAPTFAGSPPYANGIANIFQSDGKTRNASGWWGTTDLTCIPQSTSPATNGVLVTPRDMIFAAHFSYPSSGGYNMVGGSVSFVDGSNALTTRTIAAARLLVSPMGDGADIAIITLASDVPSGITPAKVMPANFRLYLPQPQWGYPAVFTNQDKTLLIGDCTATANPLLTIGQSLDAVRRQWWYSTRTLDSGSPAFHLINGSLALATDWHYVGAGPIVADNITQINTAITANGSPYSLTAASMSGFASF